MNESMPCWFCALRLQCRCDPFVPDTIVTITIQACDVPSPLFISSSKGDLPVDGLHYALQCKAREDCNKGKMIKKKNLQLRQLHAILASWIPSLTLPQRHYATIHKLWNVILSGCHRLCMLHFPVLDLRP